MINLKMDKDRLYGNIAVVEGDNKSEEYIIELHKEIANKKYTNYDLTGKTVNLVMVEEETRKGDIIPVIVHQATLGQVKIEVTNIISKSKGNYISQLQINGEQGFEEGFCFFEIRVNKNLKTVLSGEIIKDPSFTILNTSLEKVNTWDNYFKDVSPKLEQKYTTRLNEVSSQLDKIKQDKNSTLADKIRKFKIDALGFKSINILGDSITHGANALKIYDDSWSAIVRKSLQIEFNTKNYGFVNLMSPIANKIGTYKDIFVTFTNWTKTEINDYLGFYKLSSNTPNQYFSLTFQKYFQINKVGLCFQKSSVAGSVKVEVFQLGGIKKEFNINLNNSTTINTIEWLDISTLDNIDYLKVINVNGENIATGIYIMDNLEDVTINNYARSGAKISDCTDYIIENTFNTNCLIFTLGHNGGTDLDNYFTKFKKAYDKYKPLVYVFDFTWTNSRKNIADKLKDFANYCNAPYVEIIDRVEDAQTLVDGGFLSDQSHPTEEGHRIIADKILATMKTTFLSKGSINKYMSIDEETTKVNNLINNGVIVYSGKFDVADNNYRYFKDMKLRVEIKPTGEFTPTELYLGKTTGGFLALFPDSSTTGSWSANLPKTKGTHNIQQANWESAKPFVGILDIGEDITEIYNTIPDNTRIKLVYAIVSEITTQKTSLYDLMKYNS